MLQQCLTSQTPNLATIAVRSPDKSNGVPEPRPVSHDSRPERGAAKDQFSDQAVSFQIVLLQLGLQIHPMSNQSKTAASVSPCTVQDPFQIQSPTTAPIAGTQISSNFSASQGQNVKPCLSPPSANGKGVVPQGDTDVEMFSRTMEVPNRVDTLPDASGLEGKLSDQHIFIATQPFAQLAGRTGGKDTAQDSASKVIPEPPTTDGLDSAQFSEHNPTGQLLGQLVQTSCEVSIGTNPKELAKETEIRVDKHPSIELSRNGVARESESRSDENMNFLAPDVHRSSASSTGPNGETMRLSDQLIGQITAHAEVVVREGRSDFHIRIEPPELGPVRVHLSAVDDMIVARVVVHDDSVKQLLESQLHTLRQSLSEAGFSLVRFDVEQQGHGTGTPWRKRPSKSAGDETVSRSEQVASSLPWKRSSLALAGRVDVLA